jgi:hypothetical protein
MFHPRNKMWSSIYYNMRFRKALLLLPRTALGWTLLLATKINGSQLLQEFELQAFSMHSSYNPPECRISEVRDLPPHVLLFWTTEIHFGSSGFRHFSSACSHNPLKCLISKVLDMAPCVLLIWMTEIHFGSSGFGPFQCIALTIL